MKSTLAKNATTATSRGPSGVLPRVPPVVNEVLSSHGQPLDATTSHDMGSRFGHDFSKVRIHADNRAAEAAESLNSHAFTFGADIVFGAGKYSPHTNAGQRMLAHELTHVVQQHKGGDRASSEVRLNPSNHYEQEAHTVAETLSATGRSAVAPRLSAAPPSIQRVAKWATGTVDENLNLAERFATGNKHAGQTFFTLNGTPFTPKTSAADAEKALQKPTFNTTPSADRKRVECTFNKLPTNEGSFQTKTLKAGKWQFQTTKKTLAGLFPKLKPCVKAGNGDSILTIADNPDVTNNTKAHEAQHATDHEATFNKLVVPWDDQLTQGKKDKLTGDQPTDKDCRESMYATTPTDLISYIFKDINKRAKDFHDKPEGRDVSLYDAESNEECNAVRAKAK